MSNLFAPGEPNYAAVPMDPDVLHAEQPPVQGYLVMCRRGPVWNVTVVSELRMERRIAEAQCTVLEADQGGSTVEFFVAEVRWPKRVKR